MDLFSRLVLWTLVGVASVWDVRDRRIPNALIAVGIVMGLVVGLRTAGLRGVLAALVGGGVVLAILLVPWALGKLGGGDAKLAMVCGMFLGWQGGLKLILLFVALNGLLALFMLVASRASAALGRPLSPKFVQVPTAVAIAAASVLLSLEAF